MGRFCCLGFLVLEKGLLVLFTGGLLPRDPGLMNKMFCLRSDL